MDTHITRGLIDSIGAAIYPDIRSSTGGADSNQHAPHRSAPVVPVVLCGDGNPASDAGDRFFCVPRTLSAGARLFFFSPQSSHARASGTRFAVQRLHIYQQLQIHRIQSQLSLQVESLGKMEVRTEEVYKLAALDPLTGLYNRRSGEQRLAEEISRSQRYGRPLTILTLDLNGLKDVNDELGHAAGDELIKRFAERLNKAIRGSDLAVRLGGDEFLVLLPECKPEEVRHVLSRLSGLKVECNERLVEVSFAAGWTNFRPGESPEELLKRADDALYVNKRASREQGLQIVAAK